MSDGLGSEGYKCWAWEAFAKAEEDKLLVQACNSRVDQVGQYRVGVPPLVVRTQVESHQGCRTSGEAG